MKSEPFDFEGGRGQRLSGQIDLPKAEPRHFAVFAHCFTCTRRSLAAVRIARRLTAAGFGVLRFDFMGMGQSDGDVATGTFSGDVSDVVAAATAMRLSGRSPELLIGHSLGGAAVVAAAGRISEVSAVSVIGAPFDVEHVKGLLGDQLKAIDRNGEANVRIGGRPVRIGRQFVEDLSSHDQAERIRRLGRALLILHSPQDAVVDIGNAAEIFGAAMHPKSFVSLDGADHLLTDREDGEYAAKIIAAWASRYLGGQKAP